GSGQPLHVLDRLHDHQIEPQLLHLGQQPPLPAASRIGVEIEFAHEEVSCTPGLTYPPPSKTSMPGRTIAIGDIHGCAAALGALVAAIEPTADDTLVALGDYVDRGPNSRGVLDELLALAKRCRLVPLLGNHEIMLL